MESTFLTGLSLPFRAFGLIVRTPKLLGLSLLCAFVTAVALLGIAGGAWSLGGSIAHQLVTGDSAWLKAASIGLNVIFFIVLFVVGALTLPNLVLAPLQDPLSEATEVQLGNFTPDPFSLGGVVKGTLESLKHTLLRFFFMALGLAVLFPLNFIPVAGSVVWLVLSSVWSMFWIATEHLSNPMARHLRPFSEVVRALRKRLALSLGFGAALYVLLWVPVLNCFLMPVAVVAGTLLYRRLLDEGALTTA